MGLIAMTGRIEPERKPQSLLIYGNPGSGKTANVHRFKPENGGFLNPNLLFVSNATAMGLSAILTEQVPRGVTHIVVPEFQSLLLKRGGVWETMLGILLVAMEEGVGDTYVGPKKKAFGDVRLGMIACMPTDAYFHHIPMMQSTGLYSRMLVVRYDRTSDDVIQARHRMHRGDRSELTKIDLELPESIRVTVPVTVKREITEYAKTIDSNNVHRESARFEALVQAVAYTNGRRSATLDDLAQLMLIEWLWRK